MVSNIKNYFLEKIHSEASAQVVADLETEEEASKPVDVVDSKPVRKKSIPILDLEQMQEEEHSPAIDMVVKIQIFFTAQCHWNRGRGGGIL